MSQTTETLLKHRSIRKYQDRPIATELLDEVIQCGIRASTSGNMQFYSIIKTTDVEVKKALYEAHGQQAMILQAPCVLTFCADVNRLQKWMVGGNAGTRFDNVITFLRGFVDATIVAQAVVSAAESVGLGICYMGSTLNNCEKIVATLGIPKLVFPVTSIVVGWPDEDPALRLRLPPEAVVHSQKYRELSQDQVMKFNQEKDADVISRWSKNPAQKKKMDELQLKTGAQLYEAMKYSNEVLDGFSDGLIRLMKAHFNIQID